MNHGKGANLTYTGHEIADTEEDRRGKRYRQKKNIVVSGMLVQLASL